MGIYSKEFRLRAVEAVEREIPRKDVVETFSISLTMLKRWLRTRRDGEDLSPGTSTGRKRRILATLEEKQALWQQLEENDDATLERHCQLWEAKRGVSSLDAQVHASIMLTLSRYSQWILSMGHVTSDGMEEVLG